MRSNKDSNILTSTEQAVLASIRLGKSSKEIALDRNCSVRTVEKHRSNIIKKLHIEGITLQQYVISTAARHKVLDVDFDID